MKKVVLIIGVLALLHSSVGLMVQFRLDIYKWHCKVERLLKRLSPAELTVFTFPKDQFSPYVREFEWQNHLYDVVSIEYTTDFVVVRCYDDTKEKAMRSSYQKAMAEKHKKDKEKTAKDWQSFKGVYQFFTPPLLFTWAWLEASPKVAIAPDAPLCLSYNPALLKPPQV